jgi:hypothetical protein
MKLTVSVSRKIGQPNYGSEGASCGLEMELDQSSLDNPAQLADRIRAAYHVVEGAIEDQLMRAAEPVRREAPREAPLQPGDPAYDRMHPAPPEPARRPAPAPVQQSQPDRGWLVDADDLPNSGKSFAGWMGKQSEATKAKVKNLITAWKLPGLYKTWDAETVAAVVHDLLIPPPPPPVTTVLYNSGSDHQDFMRRCAVKKAEEAATRQAWLNAETRGGAYPVNNGNGRH